MSANTVTMKGNSLNLVGNRIKAGDSAPDFTVLNGDLEPVSLSKWAGKVVLIAAVPSLDTPVCDLEVKKFNMEASSLSEEVIIMSISMDLPFALKRFCSANGIDRVMSLSDHKDADFANKYGALIKELRLLTRAVFVVDRDGLVCYAEYVGELTEHPDYKSALQSIKNAL